MGLKPVIIVVVVILVLVVGAMAYYFFKSPPAQTAAPSAAKPGGTVEQGADGAAGPVQMAVANAKLRFETADGKTIIKVIIDKVTGADGREVSYKYEWTLNGQAAGDGTDHLGGFKRGDRVGVKVTPVEGDKPGQARFLDVAINNMPPVIAESKQVSFDGKTFVYQVKGTDPDGDTVSYALENAPQGMTINSQTGLITWPITENDYGERTFKVKIDDGKSGVTTELIKVDIPKPAQQEKPSEEQK